MVRKLAAQELKNVTGGKGAEDVTGIHAFRPLGPIHEIPGMKTFVKRIPRRNKKLQGRL
jgi:hypothetical protein